MRRAAAVLILAVTAMIALPPGTASAHPLGNFTVNHYDGLHLFPDHVEDFAVIDAAEIPTLQAKSTVDTNGDGTADPAERAAYATTRCADLATALRLTVATASPTFAVTRSTFEYRPGAAGLLISRLTCDLTAAFDFSHARAADFSDQFDGSGVGWHEITAVASGVALRNSPVPAQSISQTLLKYPNDLLSSPLNVRAASLSIDSSGASSYGKGFRVSGTNPFARALGHLNRFFNGLVGRDHLTFGVGLLAVLVATLLGAGHALLPGHGKTIMAAYLVGRRGRLRDVVAIGATVTATHTAGVIIIGLLISVSATFAPTTANTWLGIASGLLVVGVGLMLLRTALRGKTEKHRHGLFGSGHVHGPAETHSHDQPAHDHHHDAHEHEHHHPHPRPVAAAAGPTLVLASPLAEPAVAVAVAVNAPVKPYSRAGLVGLGIAGGLVPSPSALVVLLGAIALGRTVFGVILVLAYGLGLALTLTVAGLLLIPLRARVERLAAGTRAANATRLLALLPVMTACLVVLVGLGLAARSASII